MKMAEERVKQQQRRVIGRAIEKLQELGHFVFLAASPEVGRCFQLLGLPLYPDDRPVLVRVCLEVLEEREIKEIERFKAGAFKKETWIWVAARSRFAVFRWQERFLGDRRELQKYVKGKNPQPGDAKRRPSEGNLQRSDGYLQTVKIRKKPGV
jgi:hypothetical protein